MSARNYAAEMRTVIDEETSTGPYVSRVAAREIVEKLTANDPDLLTGWLMAQAEQLLWAAINTRDRSRRSSARTSNSRSAFGAAAKKHDAGDSTALTGWLEDGTRRVLADLTKADLDFVAKGYERDAKATTFEATFMRALAKKVGKGTVADHFDEEKIAELRQSLK